MRLPVVPALSTKDGTSNKNARLTNMLKESKASGDLAVIRPGLVSAATSTGNGYGLVAFDNELISVYGATLGKGPVTTELSASLVSYTPIADRAFYRIGYNGSIYVAVGGNTTTGLAAIYTSSDGQSWTSRTIPATGIYYSCGAVVWSGSFWLVTADDDGSGEVAVLKSSDGITWAAYLTGATALVTDSSLAYDGTYFYVCSDNNVFRSSDGQTWAYTANAIATFGMATGGGLLVTVGFGGPAVASVSSNNGVSFSDITPSASQSFTIVTDVIYDGTQFVAISGTGSGTGASVLTALTGTDMAEVAVLSTFADGVNRIAFNGSTYVATSSNGAYAVSDDLVTWTEYSEPSLSFRALCSGASQFNFLAVGTPGLITAALSVTSITPLDTIAIGTYDFAQSVI